MDVRAGFWAPTAVLSSAAPFQLCLKCPETVDISSLQFAALHISFSDSRPDVIVKASGGDDFVDMGTISSVSTVESSASLRWTAGRSLVLSAKVQSNVEGEVLVSLHIVRSELRSRTDRLGQAVVARRVLDVPADLHAGGAGGLGHAETINVSGP